MPVCSRLVLVIAAPLALVTGCTRMPEPEPVPPPPPPPVVEVTPPPAYEPPPPATGAPPPAGGGVAFVHKAPQFVVGRAYLNGPFPKQRTTGPKAVLLLRPTTRARNGKACEAFVERVSSVETLAALTDATIVPTYWLLTKPVDQVGTRDCKQLLAAYDFDQAQGLYGIYGLAQEGPMIVAVDDRDNFVFVDLTKASGKDMKRFMATWFTTMPGTGKLEIDSVTLWDRLRDYACGVVRAGTADLARTQPDLTRPDTAVRIALGTVKTVSWIGTGALMIGQTMGKAACGVPPAGAT